MYRFVNCFFCGKEMLASAKSPKAWETSRLSLVQLIQHTPYHSIYILILQSMDGAGCIAGKLQLNGTGLQSLQT